MAETTIVPENSSIPISSNENDNSNIHISDNVQFKTEFTSTSNNNSESSMTPIQMNYSTTNISSNNINTAMSNLSVHDNRTTNRYNSNRYHQNINSSYRYPTPTSAYTNPHMNQPEAQAQLVAFTPPLMSIQLPHTQSESYHRNDYSPRQYVQNQQTSLTTRPKSETAVSQPEYYVDSFAPNFSDKPSTTNDNNNNNNNNKTKTKHVTFQEPEIMNESPKPHPYNSSFVPSPSNGTNYSSSNWRPPVPTYQHSRPTSRYHHPNYAYYDYNEHYASPRHMMPNPYYTQRSRRMYMMQTPPPWPQQSYYPRQPLSPSYMPYSSQPKQLYDPNKPKVPLTTPESHDSSKVIRPTAPKTNKKPKQTHSNDNSTVSTPEPMSHPITILRKPSADAEVTSPTLIENQPVISPSTIAQEQPQQESANFFTSPFTELQPSNSSDTQSEELKPINPSNPPSEEHQQAVSNSSDISSEEAKPSNTSNLLSEEQQQQFTNSSDIVSDESQLVDSSETDQPITKQSESNSVLAFPIHELLSILQSANCISSLNEYAQQKKLSVNYEFTSIPPSSFTCIISINTRQFPPSSPCSSKNEAQKLACDQALRLLYRESCPNESTSLVFSSKHDYIAHRSISTFQQLNVSELLLGRKTLACMLMVTNQEYEQARVISIGTGNSCLDEKNLSYADDGRALHDCHAEILARRGLMKYFFEQIKLSKNNQTSIFQYNSSINKYELNENITFHMYVSTLPCGNASLNLSSNSIRYKQGQTEGTLIPSSTNSIKYPIKSCTDKISRWNILGVQGGLLINLLTKPIYLQTITIACETTFDRNHVKYSLSEHLKEHLPSSLPSSSYLLHIPDIDCPQIKSFQQERQVAKLQTNAFAWNITQSDRTELLEPRTGKLKTDRSISTLSKYTLLEDFLSIHQDDSLTYKQAKQLNETYVTVKNLISTAFQNASSSSSDGSISWLSKSDTLEQFSIE